MDKKYKVIDVEEPVNDLEEKRARENIKFVKTFIKYVVATSCTVGSGVCASNAIFMDNPNAIAAAVFSGMSVLSLCLSSAAGKDLFNLFDERETKEDENNLEEKTKSLKK